MHAATKKYINTCIESTKCNVPSQYRYENDVCVITCAEKINLPKAPSESHICLNGAQNCDFQSDYAISIHSWYDIISIVDKLQRNGDLKKCGGASYISDLTNEVVSTANVEHSAYILVQKFMQREVIRISQEAQAELDGLKAALQMADDLNPDVVA